MEMDIKQTVEGIEKSFADLKTELKTTKDKVDSLDQLKLDRITDDITLKLEDLQKEQAKLKSAMSRPANGEIEGKEFDLEQKKSFNEFFRNTKSQAEIEVRAMRTDSDPDGGYLVRPELASFVVDRVFETSPIRQVARVETIGTKSLDVLVDDQEAAARWVGEGASGGQTDAPQLGMKEIVAHKLEADPRITTEQLEDSYLDVEAWLRTKVAEKFSRSENSAFISGDGVAKPRGLTSYAAWASAGVYERNKLEDVKLGSTTVMDAAGLIRLQNALKEPYQPNAVWGMKRVTYGNALQQKGADQFFFGQTLIKDGQLQAQLLGKPVIFMDDMPAIASAARSAVYGDFGVGYTIVDRVGLQILRDPFTNKGFVTYYTYKRTGGDVTNFDALKFGVNSTV